MGSTYGHIFAKGDKPVNGVCRVHSPFSRHKKAANIIQEIVSQAETKSPDAAKFILGDLNSCCLADTLPTFHRYVNCPTRHSACLKPLDTFGKQYCPKAHTSCIGRWIPICSRSELGFFYRKFDKFGFTLLHLLFIHLQKPQQTVRTSVLRNITTFDRLLFANNVQLCNIQPAFSDSVDTVVNHYNLTLGNLLDKHAPPKTRLIPKRLNSQWYNHEIAVEKQKCRRLERKWRSNCRLEIDRELFCHQRQLVNSLVRKAKQLIMSVFRTVAMIPNNFFPLPIVSWNARRQVLFHSSTGTALQSFLYYEDW